MSEQEWTKEPWQVVRVGTETGCGPANVISSADGRLIVDCGIDEKDGEDWSGAANAARIVACVNALANIPDPAAFVEQARRDAVDAARYRWLRSMRALDLNGKLDPRSYQIFHNIWSLSLDMDANIDAALRSQP